MKSVLAAADAGSYHEEKQLVLLRVVLQHLDVIVIFF
jgi:hypothetical protein